MTTIIASKRKPSGRHRKEPARSGAGGAGRAAGRVVRGTALTLTLAVATLVVLAHGFGWSAMIIRSGSMEPTVPVGSLVLARPESGSDVRVGQAIAVQRTGTDKPVIVLHRVIALTEQNGVRFAELKGDANATPDPNPVALTKDVARPFAVIPNVGYTISSARAYVPTSRLLLIVVGAVGLWLIWGKGRPRRRAAH